MKLDCLKPIIFITILTLSSCGGVSRKEEPLDLDQDPPALAVGQAYHYLHKGPRPWGDGTTDATGGRVLAVTSHGRGKKPLWGVEEHFEKTEGMQIGYYDKEYRLHRQILRAPGGELQIFFDPPIPERYLDLKQGEEDEFTSTQQMIDTQSKEEVGTVEMTVNVRRENDVRIIVPAGAFMCRNFVSRIQLAAEIQGEKSDLSATVNSFWSDSLVWFVKEMQVFDPLVMDGEVIRPPYKTESILVSFEPQEYQFRHPVPDEKP